MWPEPGQPQMVITESKEILYAQEASHNPTAPRLVLPDAFVSGTALLGYNFGAYPEVIFQRAIQSILAELAHPAPLGETYYPEFEIVILYNLRRS